mmetsp:Transcript_8345/g.18063  ORF Transcript_8345/g.18063 Transcript_8345/m.18063 type:complete len:363 (-) Transcript_8345:3207-4295(-)
MKLLATEQERLHNILTYLGPDKLNTLVVSFDTDSEPFRKKKHLIEDAAQLAYNATLNEHRNMTPEDISRTIRHDLLFGSSTATTELIQASAYYSSPIMKYRHLRYGPSHHIHFNKFTGAAFQDSCASDFYYVFGPRRRDNSGIATMTDQIMSSGQHYASFTLKNLKGREKDIVFEVGVMRPLPLEYWEDRLDMEGRLRIQIKNQTDMRWMNSHRDNQTWIGTVDCCLFDPRGKVDFMSGDPTPFATVNEYYWAEPERYPYQRANERLLSRGYTDGREKGTEEAGLYLDLEAGTLSYYRSGMFVMDIASGLEGDYVWVVYANMPYADIKDPMYIAGSCKFFSSNILSCDEHDNDDDSNSSPLI